MTATHGEGAYGNATGVTTPTAHKMAQVTEFVKTTTANVIRPGVLYNGTASLVAGKANMSYDVLPFSIATQRSATSGVMKWANDGTVNVVTTAAPGSNSRIDVVYAWHREYALDGTDSNPVIGVVQGTPAASPTVPSLVAFPGAVELARITVPAGVTATNSGTTITQTASFTSTDGGKVPFRTTTEMNVWTTALTGQHAVDLSTGITYRYSGSAWKEWDSPKISDTPNLGGVTEGSGTFAAWHQFVKGQVHAFGDFTLGSGSSVTGSVTVPLPVAAAARYGTGQRVVGSGLYGDTGVGAGPLVVSLEGSTTQAVLQAVATGGTYGTLAYLSSTVPFALNSGDVISWDIWYDPA